MRRDDQQAIQGGPLLESILGVRSHMGTLLVVGMGGVRVAQILPQEACILHHLRLMWLQALGQMWHIEAQPWQVLRWWDGWVALQAVLILVCSICWLDVEGPVKCEVELKLKR